MAAPGDILVLANTVRYLAQSARASGHAVHAIDAYADLDTRRACQRLFRAAEATPQALLAALSELVIDQDLPWTYGAGFETAPEVLQGLARRNRNLLGNDPRLLLLLSDPSRFFALLDELDIAYPQTRQQLPANCEGWLFKPAGRLGGLGVRWARDAMSGHAADGSAGYYQTFVRGTLCSLLFAADTRDVAVVGYNRMMARYPSAGDFRYAGAVSGFAPTHEQQDLMLQVARRLTRALGLRGINGLDFVIRQGEPLLLELNARPPATLELYESCLPGGGFASHLEACRGRLPSRLSPDPVRGIRVLYARRSLSLADIDWPAWTRDRPAPGTQIVIDQPFCTVHAEGGDIESVEATLRQRADALDCLIRGFSEEAA